VNVYMNFVVSLVIASTLAGASGFYPIVEDRGVKVYRRDQQRGIELGAEGDIPAPPDVVLKILTDYASHPKWVHNLAESRVLARQDHGLDVYQRLDLPFIEDRDFTLHVTWGGEGGARWLRFNTANQRGPGPQHKVIRVNTHEGGWILEPTDGGRSTHAVYQFHLDLAGSFPSWMGKGRAGKDLPGLFENVRKQVQYYR
jgi:hypothetical protein